MSVLPTAEGHLQTHDSSLFMYNQIRIPTAKGQAVPMNITMGSVGTMERHERKPHGFELHGARLLHCTSLQCDRGGRYENSSYGAIVPAIRQKCQGSEDVIRSAFSCYLYPLKLPSTSSLR
jgi:hypothetical protein